MDCLGTAGAYIADFEDLAGIEMASTRCREHTSVTLRVPAEGDRPAVLVVLTRLMCRDGVADAVGGAYRTAQKARLLGGERLTDKEMAWSGRVRDRLVALAGAFEEGPPEGWTLTLRDVGWLLTGWTAAEQEQAETAGMTLFDATRWSQWAELDPPDLIAWRQALCPDRQTTTADTDVVRDWMREDVMHPSDRPAGLDSTDVTTLRLAGVPCEPGWAMGETNLCPDLIAYAHSLGKPPAAAVAVIEHLTRRPARNGDPCAHKDPRGRFHYCDVTAETSRRIWARLATVKDLDWAALSVCLTAGMTWREAREHVIEGRDMQPVQVMAGLLWA